MEAEQSLYLKFISYPKFDLWDVKRYTNAPNLNFDNIVRLSEILTPFKMNVSKQEMINRKLQIIAKINFGGQLFLREFDEIHTYKGNLNLVPENAIIYSKINVRHGCIYFNEKGAKSFGVSSEYPIFTFDESKVNGKFLQKILRSDAFKKLLNSKSSGISKARVKQDEFLDIQIPLPNLQEQQKIVNAYYEKIKQVHDLQNQAENLESEIEKYLFEELGVDNSKNSNTRVIGKFLKIFNYEDINKWGVDKNSSNNLVLKKPFEIVKIENICTVSSGGTPNRSIKEYYKGSIPWIKTGEVVNNIIYDTEEKITEEAIKNSSAKIYPKESLIIAMYGQGLTRGRTAKLGIDASTNQACAVLFNIDNSKILTDYLWIYLIGEYDRLRELASGNSQPNLNAQMIKEYKIIIPPFEIQKKIIDTISTFKIRISELINNSTILKTQAEEKFENALFN